MSHPRKKRRARRGSIVSRLWVSLLSHNHYEMNNSMPEIRQHPHKCFMEQNNKNQRSETQMESEQNATTHLAIANRQCEKEIWRRQLLRTLFPYFHTKTHRKTHWNYRKWNMHFVSSKQHNKRMEGTCDALMLRNQCIQSLHNHLVRQAITRNDENNSQI